MDIELNFLLIKSAVFVNARKNYKSHRLHNEMNICEIILISFMFLAKKEQKKSTVPVECINTKVL